MMNSCNKLTASAANFQVPPTADDPEAYGIIESTHKGKPILYIPVDQVSHQLLETLLCDCPIKAAYVKKYGSSALVPIVLPSHMNMYAAKPRNNLH